MAKERIIAAAIYHGYIHTMPPPARHHTILWAMRDDPGPYNQGFLTSTGRYISRAEAVDVAYRSGQCKTPKVPNKLFSEDLW